MAALIARALRRAADWVDGRSGRVRPSSDREVERIAEVIAALGEGKRKGGRSEP